ncbi:hypothetical protein JKF63_00225 [Porcisia hertigi]|uniref:Uncharacterized protein n=1 Tax=Porcisia hertigi TaxID=2761500 RepID=A0A836I4L5_9TRYP|nr:hypothetical protein JKF63_00225 [Porcisia hertigi]
MQENGHTTATASQPPSYESVLVFLSSLAQWLKVAQEHLTCKHEAGRHAIAVEVLTRYYESVYGPLEEFVWRRTTAVSEARSIFPTASVQLTAWVFLRVLLFLVAWRMLMRLVRATTLPRLRARQIASHCCAHLSWLDNARVVEALIWSDAAQRGINATLLWTVGACGAVACLLILGLLTMHVWVDTVLWHVLQRWMLSLSQVQAWVSSCVWWPSGESPTGAATPLVEYATSFLSVVSAWQSNLLAPLVGLRRIMQQIKIVYLWSMIGGAVLGVALWLLSYSSRLLQIYNASLPYFEENDSLMRWLAQQEAEATQQCADAAVVALLEGQRWQEKVMERLTNSLAQATNQERQRCLDLVQGGGGQDDFRDDATLAAATSDASEDVQCGGDPVAPGSGAEMVSEGCIASGQAGSPCKEFEVPLHCALHGTQEEEASAAAATGEEEAAGGGRNTLPRLEKVKEAATNTSCGQRE